MVALELLSREEREQIAAVGIRNKNLGINEPTLTRFTPAQLLAKLRQLGFSKAIDFTSENAQKRYFEGRRDGLSADRASHLMRAMV